MRLLYPILKDLDIDGIRKAALAIGATVFGAVNVYLFNLIQPRGFWQLVLGFAAGVATLTVLVRLTQRVLLRCWAAPVLGRWLYESSSGNWGLAEIDIEGGELTYSVQLYPGRREATAAHRGEPEAVAACFATVTSIGVTYRGGTTELIYKIDRTSDGYAPRNGMLTLAPLTPTAMKGYWSSDIDGDEPRRGILNMYRAETVGGTTA